LAGERQDVTGPGAETEAMWREVLTSRDSPLYRKARVYKHVPGDPRCKMCKVPLAGVVAPVLRLTGTGPSPKNPRFCNRCELWAKQNPGGAEIELTLLFADVRGSTRLAEDVGATRFAELMQRFYRISNSIFITSDAMIDKPVGDEVIALYFPLFADDHATKAVRAALSLLVQTGHDSPDGAWLPVGAGVHTGNAFVGTVGVEGTNEYDITALGDAVNVTARLASAAAGGEVLVSEDAYSQAGLDLGSPDTRTLEIRGRSAPLDVRVLTAAHAVVEDASRA
jgi:adenylate cyclase